MNYVIEANIGIVFFYSIYLLMLRNETDFSKQRAFLVGGLLCSLLFPLIQIQSSFVGQSEIGVITLPEFVAGAAPAVASRSWSLTEIGLVVYILVAIAVGAPLLLHALRLYQTIKNGAGIYRNDNYYVIESSDNVPSWSFFKLIYIGRSAELTNEDRELIMKHEMLHGQLYHSADMLFATLLCIVFWFNPFAWLYRRTLAKVHEFQVDATVAGQNGVANYTELLVKSALAGNRSEERRVG